MHDRFPCGLCRVVRVDCACTCSFSALFHLGTEASTASSAAAAAAVLPRCASWIQQEVMRRKSTASTVRGKVVLIMGRERKHTSFQASESKSRRSCALWKAADSDGEREGGLSSCSVSPDAISMSKLLPREAERTRSMSGAG